MSLPTVPDTDATSPTLRKHQELPFFGIHREHFPSIDSTQTYLAERRLPELQVSRLLSSNRTAVYIASSDHQSLGRGKASRSWFSTDAHINVAMSILFAIPAHIIAKAALFTQMLAVAAARSLERNFAGSDVKMKWPNDLIILGRKVGGILAELHPIDSNSNAIIIGIGINLDFPNEILDAGISLEGRWPAGAVKQLLGVDIDASRLRDTIATDFLREIESFINTGALSVSTSEEISRRQHSVGSEIQFNEYGPETIIGIHRGLDASTGGIIIELPDGNRRVFHSGELIFRQD